MNKFLLVLLCLSLLANAFLVYEKLDKKRVTRVIDGDTFELRSGERIRLLSLNAPDKNACLGIEATELLKTLILNSRVRLEETQRDDFGRTLAIVIAKNKNINLEMVKAGLSTYLYSSKKYNKIIGEALRQAKQNKQAIYSDKCQSKTPPDPKCIIKGNIDESSRKKFYHSPDCLHYEEAIINTALGEKWFCSQEEAEKSGFAKASGC